MRLKAKQTKLDDKTAELQAELDKTKLQSEAIQRARERTLKGYVADVSAPDCPVCWTRDGLRVKLQRLDPAAGIGLHCTRCRTVVGTD